MASGDTFPDGKTAGAWSWPFTPSLPRLRNEWSFFSTLPYAFMACTTATLRYVSPVSVFAVWAVLIPNHRNTLTPGQEIEWCHACSRPLSGWNIPVWAFPSLVACPRPNRRVVRHRHFVKAVTCGRDLCVYAGGDANWYVHKYYQMCRNCCRAHTRMRHCTTANISSSG